MKRAGWAAVVVALAAPLAACNKETPFEVIEQVAFDPSLGINLSVMTRLPEGVYIFDDVVGTGPPIAPLDSVTVSHTGWLRDAQVFSDGTFCVIYLGTQGTQACPNYNLIDGVEIGMDGMALGGRRLMIIPPELGYGSNPVSFIPKGAVLVFEFEIVSIN